MNLKKYLCTQHNDPTSPTNPAICQKDKKKKRRKKDKKRTKKEKDKRKKEGGFHSKTEAILWFGRMYVYPSSAPAPAPAPDPAPAPARPPNLTIPPRKNEHSAQNLRLLYWLLFFCYCYRYFPSSSPSPSVAQTETDNFPLWILISRVACCQVDVMDVASAVQWGKHNFIV